MTEIPELADLPPLAEVTAYRFDGTGRGAACAAEAPIPEAPGFTWVHVIASREAGRAWLETAGLDTISHDALTATETRPRCTAHDDGALINLRGVNLNPGADPEDMVSLRIYAAHRRVISVQLRPVRAVRDVMDGIDAGVAPVSPGELVARLALWLADRTEPVVARLNERIDDLEDGLEVLTGPDGERRQALPPVSHIRAEISEIRRVAVLLRRYMFPQRDALSTAEILDLDWLAARDRVRLRESTERVTRLAEDLDAIRDRAQLLNEQLLDLRAEAMNRQMMVLSVVAAIFLPLGLITGLLGINVAGMPGAAWPGAFWAVCAALVVICLFQIWLFRRIGLLER